MKHGKNAKEPAKTLINILYAYNNNVHSITGDNGTEFTEHQNIDKEN